MDERLIPRHRKPGDAIPLRWQGLFFLPPYSTDLNLLVGQIDLIRWQRTFWGLGGLPPGFLPEALAQPNADLAWESRYHR
jgi:hypothetical protein